MKDAIDWAEYGRIIAAMPFLLLATAYPASAVELSEALLDTIAVVESNRDDSADGDGGRARGRYQLHKAYVEDVNRIAGTSFSHKDAHDPGKARQMVRIYLNHYGRVYARKTGTVPSSEVFCRIHNGGPSGWRKKATLRYWERCRKLLGQ